MATEENKNLDPAPTAENTPVEQAAPAPKKDKRKKDPNDPTLVPFQLITVENRERLSRIGKPDNSTLSILLNAYENKSAAISDEKAAQEIMALKNQVQIYKTDLQKAMDNAAKELKNAQDQNTVILKANDEFSKKITALEQQIAALTAENTALKQENEQLQQTASASAGAQDNSEFKVKLQEMQDRATRAEDEIKDNRKTIEKLLEVKKELEKQLDKVTNERDTAQSAYLNADRKPNAPVSLNLYPEGDILHYFPALTARMLEVTAHRLTSKRKDGLEVTPQMILGDMFNKYTIQRWNNWFYWPVLTDGDIIEIATDIDERLSDIRMVKAAIGIE